MDFQPGGRAFAAKEQGFVYCDAVDGHKEVKRSVIDTAFNSIEGTLSDAEGLRQKARSAFRNGGSLGPLDRFNCVSTNSTNTLDLVIRNVLPGLGEKFDHHPVSFRAKRLQRRASGLAISHGGKLCFSEHCCNA